MVYFTSNCLSSVKLSYCLLCGRPWSMTSTLSWWKMPVWACVLRYIVRWNRAISSWMKRTKRAWRSLVGASLFFSSLSSHFSLVCLLKVFFKLFLLHFQKLWISLEWTYLAKCTISGRTKSASARTAKDWSQLLASPRTWRNVSAWDATAVASPTAGRSIKVIQDWLLYWSKMGINVWSDCFLLFFLTFKQASQQ